MIGSILALVVLGGTQGSVSPAALVGSAMTHYASAKTISGRIVWTQSAMDVKLVTESTLELARPSKIMLKQTRTGNQARTWALTSDGQTFSYDKPQSNPLVPDRLEESVLQNGKALTVQEMYLAANDSLGDRSPVLDLAISHTGYLGVLRSRLATLSYGGKVKVRDIDAKVVNGDLRPRPGDAPTGTFEMYITDAGDILKYVEKFRVADQKTKTVVEITSVWDVDLKVDAPIDNAVFQVIR